MQAGAVDSDVEVGAIMLQPVKVSFVIVIATVTELSRSARLNQDCSDCDA